MTTAQVFRALGGFFLGLFLLLLANATMLSPMVVSYIDPRSGAGVITLLLAAVIGAAAGGFAAGIAGPTARAVPLMVAAVIGVFGLSRVMEYGADFHAFLVAFVQAPFCALGGEFRRRAFLRKPPPNPPT